MSIQLLEVSPGLMPKTAISLVSHDEGGETPGQLIFWDYSTEPAATKEIFHNGDSLYGLYVSPQGDIWVGSNSGNVYTTAEVEFPESTAKPRFTLKNEKKKVQDTWHMTTLEPALGEPNPSIRALWSSDGKTIFVGTAQGTVHVWDGNEWTLHQMPVSNGRAADISHFCGSSTTDVFAIGSNDRVLLHFDGKTWKDYGFDAKEHGQIAKRGLVRMPTGEYWLGLTEGKVLRLKGEGKFAPVAANPDVFIHGIVVISGELFVAGGEKGVFRVQVDQIVSARDTSPAMSAWGGGLSARAFFVRPEVVKGKETTTSFVVFPYSDKTPWVGLKKAFSEGDFKK